MLQSTEIVKEEHVGSATLNGEQLKVLRQKETEKVCTLKPMIGFFNPNEVAVLAKSGFAALCYITGSKSCGMFKYECLPFRIPYVLLLGEQNSEVKN